MASKTLSMPSVYQRQAVLQFAINQNILQWRCGIIKIVILCSTADYWSWACSDRDVFQLLFLSSEITVMMHQDRAGHEVTTNYNMREIFSKIGVFFLSSSATDCSMDIMADTHDGCLIESMAPVGTADNHRGFLMMTAISTKNHCSRWPKNSHSEIQIKRKTVLDWSQDSSAVPASSRPAKAPFFFLPGRREIVVGHCQCQDWASPTIMYIYIFSFIIEDKQ